MRNFSPASLAASLWNHGPRMWQAMAAKDLPVTPLTANEIADLYAHFHSIRYLDARGEASRGKASFTAKNCSTRHDQQASGAPDLRQHRGQFSSHHMAAAVWRHGPKMQGQMEKQGLGWPVLTGAQMADLVAYVNAR